MWNCIAVGIGGFIGSVMRYLLGMIPVKENLAFPINTFAINVLGALVIGVIVGLSLKDNSFSPRLILFLKVGVCGGFTTFSTFSNETLQLIQSGRVGLAIVYALLSVVTCVAAVLLGQILVK